MFAVQSAGAIMQHGQQKKAVAARNRAKLANFNAENEAYVAQTILDNTQWKNSVQNSEVAIDDIFQSTAKQWEIQDQQMSEVHAKHAFNTIDILTEMYANEYAGEQTGVTAGRLAGASVRDAGMKLSKSVADVILAKNRTYLNKEIATQEANAKIRNQYEKIRQSPIPGHTPLAPEYEAGPSTSGLMLSIAMNAATATMGGLKLKALGKQNKALQGIAEGMKGATDAASTASAGGGGFFSRITDIFQRPDRWVPNRRQLAASTGAFNVQEGMFSGILGDTAKLN